MQNLIGLLVMIIFLTHTSWAGMRLVAWQVKDVKIPLILPVRDSETYVEAVDRYVKNFSNVADLADLFQGAPPLFETFGFSELSAVSVNRDDRVLLQANRDDDYTNKSRRVEKFNHYFTLLQQQNFLLLINPTVGLSLAEQRQVFDLIYEQFAIYAGLGGDDVDPLLAKQENFHSKNTNYERDRAELNLIRHFIHRGQTEKDVLRKSFYFGTCRASQLASVGLGYKLIQDIPFQVGSTVSHSQDWHAIKLLTTSNNLLKDLPQNITVNSLHHQSMIFKTGGFLELAAISPDGIVEATEFKNGRGLLVQFHAELMNDSIGAKILSNVIQAKNNTGLLRCQKLFVR